MTVTSISMSPVEVLISQRPPVVECGTSIFPVEEPTETAVDMDEEIDENDQENTKENTEESIQEETNNGDQN